MTDYVPFPEFTLTLPETAKVKGGARLVVRGNTGVILTGSEHRVLSPTGKEYSVALELVRENGEVRPAEGNSQRGNPFTGPWQEGFKDAPKTHAQAMTAALVFEAQAIWTDQVEARGKIATASQALHRLGRKRVEAQEALTQIIDDQVKHQHDLDEALAQV